MKQAGFKKGDRAAVVPTSADTGYHFPAIFGNLLPHDLRLNRFCSAALDHPAESNHHVAHYVADPLGRTDWCSLSDENEEVEPAAWVFPNQLVLLEYVGQVLYNDVVYHFWRIVPNA